MNRTARALRSTVVVSAFGYAAQALSFAAIPLYLTTIGAESYGLMVTVMALMGYVGFADAGLSWGSMILIAQANGREARTEIAHVVRHSAVLAVGSGLLVALIVGGILLGASAGWRLPMFVHHPEADRLVVIAGVQLGLNLQFGIFYNLFQGLQESHWTGLYQGAARVLGLLGGMLAAGLTQSVEAVMLVQLALTGASGVGAAIHALNRHRWAFKAGPWRDVDQYRQQLGVGGKNFLLQIGRTLSGTAPTLALSALIGPAAVPLYTVPTTLLMLFFAPINTWSANLQSAYGEAWATGDREWVRRAFRSAIERTLTLGGLGVAGFLALGDTFVRLWTAGRLAIEPAMGAAVVAMVLAGSLLTAGQYLLTGLNRHRRAALAELASGLLALVLVPAAVLWLGLPGVGPGVIGAGLVTSAWVLRREIGALLGLGAFPTWPIMLKAAATTFAATAVAVLLRRSLDGAGVRPPVQIIATGGMVVAAYVAIALLLRLVALSDAAAVGQWLKGRRPIRSAG